MSRTKGGSTQKYIWPWMCMVCRSELLLQKVPYMIGKQASNLIEGIKAEHLLADKAYDGNDIILQANLQGMNVVIPPKANRKTEREFDRYLYRLRHLVENAFYISKGGEESLQDTQKTLLLS